MPPNKSYRINNKPQRPPMNKWISIKTSSSEYSSDESATTNHRDSVNSRVRFEYSYYESSSLISEFIMINFIG